MTMEIDMAHEISALRARLAEVERERDVYRDDAIRYVGLLAEARDERDAAIADAARLREVGCLLVGECEEQRECPVCGTDTNAEVCRPSCYVAKMRAALS